MPKELLFSVKKGDLDWDYSRGSGKGGQKRNKTSNVARCKHTPSGAVGRSEDTRSQSKNRKIALRRLAESPEFKQWARVEAARLTGVLERIKKEVDESMTKIRCETRDGGKWVENNEFN